MSQTSLDDDELFGEAAEDLRGDIEASLEEARAALPDPDTVWEADADNVIGVLNGLRAAMDPGDAQSHLRDAKKWYTMGERAHAFADGDDLQGEIEDLEAVIEEMADARERISDLAGTVPELRNALEEAHANVDEGDEATDGGTEPDEEGADASGDGGDSPEAEADGGQPEDDGEQATLED